RVGGASLRRRRCAACLHLVAHSLVSQGRARQAPARGNAAPGAAMHRIYSRYFCAKSVACTPLSSTLSRMWLVLTLVLVGAALLLLETILPGMVAGILGMCCLIAGIVIGYTNYGMRTGNWIL